MQKNAGNYHAVIDSPIGKLGIILNEANNAVTHIDFLAKQHKINAPNSPAVKRVCKKIQAYFDKQHTAFDIDTEITGTTFQLRVWKALTKIPAGKVKTYGQLAKQLNTSARAIGNACRQNPVPLIIPCHRIVASSGMGGFSGKTSGKPLQIKEWLLEHEAQ